MPSFDIVSSFDMQEIDNAVNMVVRDMLIGMILEVAAQMFLLIRRQINYYIGR